MALNIMTGNRALLKLKGETIGAGIVQNVNVSDDYGLQDIDGLGSAETIELVPGKVSHNISLSKFFVYNKKLKDLGIAPSSSEYLTSGDIDIEIIDNVTQTTIEHYAGCKLASSSRSYGKHAPSSDEGTFRALTKII